MDVKIGMNMLLWEVAITPEHIPIMAMIKDAGFDGVEIPIADAQAQQLDVLAQACDDLGLERTACTFMTPDVNPISPDPATRQAALDYIKQRVDQAHGMNAPIIVGGFHQTHKYFTGAAPTDAEWAWCRDLLRAGGEYAATAGIQFGLEFLNRFEAYLLNNSADSKRMVEDVGLSNVGVLYDTHHANIEDPDPVTAITGLKGAVNHIHISESHRGTLGTGQVDFASTFAALKAIDYRGRLVIESFGRHNPAIIPAANIWRNAFASEEQVCRSGIAFIKAHLEGDVVV